MTSIVKIETVLETEYGTLRHSDLPPALRDLAASAVMAKSGFPDRRFKVQRTLWQDITNFARDRWMQGAA